MPGNTIDANVRAFGISSTQGDDTSIGKNTAPVSLTLRKTSDNTSMSVDARADKADDRSWR